MQLQIMASLLYSAWADAAKWRSPSGRPLPDYVDLDGDRREQWLAAARVALAQPFVLVVPEIPERTELNG